MEACMPVPTKKKSRITGKMFRKASGLTSPRNAATFLADATFGENDPEMPLPLSMIPGVDLVDKTSKGLRPGLLDIPGANVAKAAALLGLSKSALMDLFRQFGSKIAAKSGEKTADLVGKDLSNRLMRLPEELREPAAATIIGKKGTVPLLDVPGVDTGNPLSTALGTKSYYNGNRGFGGAPNGSNQRFIWADPNMVPEEQSREIAGRLLGNALPAEWTKFGKGGSMRLGMENEGSYGRDMMQDILGANRGLFSEMKGLSDAGDSKMLTDYLSRMQDNRMLRDVQKFADPKGDESILELSELFSKKSGGVPLKNFIDPDAKNQLLKMGLEGGVTQDAVSSLMRQPAGRSVRKFVEEMNSDYPKEDLFKLLAGGSEAMGDATLVNRFGNAGGLDLRRLEQNMLPTMFKNITDRSNTIPLKKGFDKTLRKMEKTGADDPRQIRKGKVRKFDFEDYE